MEQKVLQVVYSELALNSLREIHDYGAETFSVTLASRFVLNLVQKVDALSSDYLLYTECRFLPTKSKKYRMFAFAPYQVIYRITKERIEVLLIIHKSQSISRIRSARRVKIT